MISRIGRILLFLSDLLILVESAEATSLLATAEATTKAAWSTRTARLKWSWFSSFASRNSEPRLFIFIDLRCFCSSIHNIQTIHIDKLLIIFVCSLDLDGSVHDGGRVRCRVDSF